MEEASWKGHHGGGIMEEASERHLGCIMEEASWRRHLRGIWEASGRIWEASEVDLGGI